MKTFYKNLLEQYRLYIPTEKEEYEIKQILKDILGKYNKEELFDIIYVCIKELVISYTEKNVRKVVENKVEAEEVVERIVEKMLREDMMGYLKQKLKLKGLEIALNIYEIPGGLSFEVINSIALDKSEDMSLREKLSYLMSKVNVKDTGVPLEMFEMESGEGKHFALILWLLKHSDINPKYFRIGNVEGKTMSRIEVPVNENFVSIRDLYS